MLGDRRRQLIWGAYLPGGDGQGAKTESISKFVQSKYTNVRSERRSMTVCAPNHPGRDLRESYQRFDVNVGREWLVKPRTGRRPPVDPSYKPHLQMPGYGLVSPPSPRWVTDLIDSPRFVPRCTSTEFASLSSARRAYSLGRKSPPGRIARHTGPVSSLRQVNWSN